MTDLQSVALATWLRSRRTVDRHNQCFELNLPNRKIQNSRNRRTKVPSEAGADRSHRLGHGQPTWRGTQGNLSMPREASTESFRDVDHIPRIE